MIVSNIEPLARAIAMRVFLSSEKFGPFGSSTGPVEINTWVDAHWECVAADLEAGLIDEKGNHIPGA